jgi:hypothetical protein
MQRTIIPRRPAAAAERAAAMLAALEIIKRGPLCSYYRVTA